MQKVKIKKSPGHLKESGRKFWRQVLRDYALKDAHHLELLAGACACLDRITEARETIDLEGAFINDRFGQRKQHPGIKVELDNKTLFARLIRELCLDITPDDPRPPRQY